MGSVKGRELRVAICPICRNFESKRITLLEKHIVVEHGRDLKSVWDEFNGGPAVCACGCGEVTKWSGWWGGYSKVLSGHNGSIYSMYGEDEAKRISEKRKESLRGKVSWSKGLTAESDERVKKRAKATAEGRKSAFDSGKLEIWNKGKTVENDERVAAGAIELKGLYAKGTVVPWAKGLSKKTDKRIAGMAIKVSMVLRQEKIRRHLDGMKRLSVEEIKRRVESSGRLRVVNGLENYTNDAQKAIQVKCSSCEEVFYGSLRSLQYGKCFKCSPGGSIAQENIATWLEGVGCVVKRNDRSMLGGLELDIHVPGGNLAIEYNGLYWHSHTHRSSNYHENKTKLAREAGINLIHIFEDEWRDKGEIIKSMICSRLGIDIKSIGARRCVVKQIDSRARKIFFEENHVDGDVTSTVAWGLYFGEDLVYAMSIRRPFHKKEGVMEVARCAAKKFHNVQGGLSRLVKLAIQWCKEHDYKNLMTYVDTRHGGMGEGYLKAGFSKAGRTPPRFWWTDFENRYNRFKYKADSQKGLTEVAVAEAAGVVKIWGCENIIFKIDI